MKVLFTIILGAALGWVHAQWDVEGQLALEQHQLELNQSNQGYRTSVPGTELTFPLPSGIDFSR